MAIGKTNCSNYRNLEFVQCLFISSSNFKDENDEYYLEGELLRERDFVHESLQLDAISECGVVLPLTSCAL